MSATVELLERLKPAFRSPKSGLFTPKKPALRFQTAPFMQSSIAESTDCLLMVDPSGPVSTPKALNLMTVQPEADRPSAETRADLTGSDTN